MGRSLWWRGPGWLLATALISCGHAKTKDAPPATSALTQKMVEKASLVHLDEVDCDGTLWRGLAKAAGVAVDLAAVEYAPGEIHRRPESSGECYPAESKSTVSNDMLTGYLWGVWRSRDLGAAERLASYGEAHSWVMGKGEVTRTVLRPNGQVLLGDVLFELGGEDKSYRRQLALYLAAGADYERHLTSLGVALSAELGTATGEMAKAARDLHDSDPGDWTAAATSALFTGAFSDVETLLLSDPPCPSYTRGSEANCLVSWLFAARLISKP